MRRIATLACVFLLAIGIVAVAGPADAPRAAGPGPAGAPAQPTGEEYEEGDADVPPFAAGLIAKDEYLRQRGDYIAEKRGLDQVPAGVREAAITDMQAAPRAGFGSPDPAETVVGSGAPTVWTNLGPEPIPNGQRLDAIPAHPILPVTGRVSAIALHPTNVNIAYVGAAGGGVYRTLDAGTTWTPIFDQAESLAIGALALAPSNPQILYVGTGESAFSGDSYAGVGLYRIDNAATAATLNGPINPGGTTFTNRAISSIVVHATNPAQIWVASTAATRGNPSSGTNFPASIRGLRRSDNSTAAAGAVTFAKLGVTPLGAGENVDMTDAERDPASTDTILVAVNDSSGSPGIYRIVGAAGLGTSTLTLSNVFDRGELSAARAPGETTTTVIAAVGLDGANNGQVFRSINGGASFGAALPPGNGFCGSPSSSQCFYDIAVALDPVTTSTFYLGGAVPDGNPAAGNTNLAVSTNNGATIGDFLATGLHADTHAIEVSPANPNHVWVGNDGGIYRTTNRGVTWQHRNTTGFVATQFQAIDTHPTDPRFTIGGTQDNGTVHYRPDGTWNRIDFGDGGHALIDQNAADTSNVTMYHTYFNRTTAMAYAKQTTVVGVEDNWPFYGCGFGGVIANGFICPASEVLFYAPMARGPGSPNTIYFGSDRLYRSTDAGVTMVDGSGVIVAGQAISAIAISPGNDGVRLVGLRNGRVFKSISNVAVAEVPTGLPPALTRRAASAFALHPTLTDVAWVAYGGFMDTTNFPARQHVYKTTNLSAPAGSVTWTAAGTGLPDLPVNSIVVDPINPNRLFVGNDIGVYVSDGGATWTPFGVGLPALAVFDLAFSARSAPFGGALKAATHGRGLWEIGFSSGSIGGTVFDDLDGDGVLDGGEPGLPGRSVLLDLNSNGVADGGEPLDTTSGAGTYHFQGLIPGTYTVRSNPAPGATATTPVSVSQVVGSLATFVNFGSFVPVLPGSIPARSFNDNDGDGVLDAGEPGNAGRTITVSKVSDNSTVATLVTGASGTLNFAGIVSGTYRVRETLPAGHQRTTADPADVTITSGLTGPNQLFGSRAIVVAAPARTYLFAEGTTRAGFFEELDLANTLNQPISVEVQYQLSQSTPGPNQTKTYNVAALSTLAVNVGAEIGTEKDVSLAVKEVGPVTGGLVAERLVYFDRTGWTGFHDQVGVPAAANNWFFGEGTTLPTFDEFLTLQNPGAAPSTVLLTYQPDGCQGPAPGAKTIVVPAASRTTVNVRDPGDPNGAGGVTCTGLGASIAVQSGPPIVAERPLYFVHNFGAGIADDGHDAFGATQTATEFFLAEGTTLDGFNEFLTIANPGGAPANVTIQYSDENGVVTPKSIVVPAGQRVTVQVYNPADPGGLGPGRVGVSARVTSNLPIVVERPLYVVRDVGSGLVTGGHIAQGVTTIGATYTFAAGSTRTGFDTFLTVANLNAQPANLTLQTFGPGGQITTVNKVVPANTRSTFRYTEIGVPGGVNGPIGLRLTSDRPVVAERPSYAVIIQNGLNITGAANAAGYPG